MNENEHTAQDHIASKAPPGRSWVSDQYG